MKRELITADISYAPSCKLGNMNCAKCGIEITEGYYLIENHYVSKRGNEDDFHLALHRPCSINRNNECKNAWNDFDEENNLTKIRITKKKQLKKAIKLLKTDDNIVNLVLSEKIKTL